jgi:GH15 family glucan-1,4-alpha-glucosidase
VSSALASGLLIDGRDYFREFYRRRRRRVATSSWRDAVRYRAHRSPPSAVHLGRAVAEPLPALCDRFFHETVRYWRKWVKHCNVPFLYQQAVIRSALALKLHCYEDTGAIIAASTTSVPEFPGSRRTWDYRYCWLRDAYYVLDAFRLLGHFEEREQFVQYLLDVAMAAPGLELAPLYRIDGRGDLEEVIIEHWDGFQGEKPVRVGNAAAAQTQYDVYGELVLALTPIFLDDRFRHDASHVALDLIRNLARRAIAVAGKPDAGIWEARREARPQTFSSLMSWAAADRMAMVAARVQPEAEKEFRDSRREHSRGNSAPRMEQRVGEPRRRVR